MSASAGSYPKVESVRTRSRWWEPIGIFVGIFAVVFAIYGNMSATLLHAESGHYQLIAHRPAADQKAFLRTFWTTSSHGHYTPLAFGGEFLFTKWAGLRPAFWRNRQLAVAAVFAAAIFFFVRAPVRGAGGSRMLANSLAAGVTALLILQPLMNSLIGWPFHIMQILWLILALATGISLVQMMRFPESRKWIWITAGLAYSSMHALGLGFVIVAGVLSVFITLLLGMRAGCFTEFALQRKSLLKALVALALLGVIHSICMVALNNAPPTSAESEHFAWRQAFGLLALYPLTIVIQLAGERFNPDFTSEITRNASPFGLLLALLICTAVVLFIRRSLRRTEPASRIAMALSIFSAVALFAFILMIALREAGESTSQMSVYGYLIGARYVFPATILWLGLVLSLGFEMIVRHKLQVELVSIAIVIAALCTRIGYARTIQPRVAPLHGASDMKVWRSIRAAAAEARAAHLAIPNIPLGAMTEFPFDLKFFEPLLHDDLHLPPDERCQFVDWSQSRGPLRSTYDAAAPSLRSVIRVLDLEPPLTR